MKQFTTFALSALGLVALASGCAVDGAPQEETGTTQEAMSCSNDQATMATLASMAIVAANEMGRWLPARDLECEGDSYNKKDANGVWIPVDVLPAGAPDGLADEPGRCMRPANTSNGYKQFRVGLSPKGRAKCADKVCRNMKSLLSLQDDRADGMVFGGQALNPGLLRTRMEAYWNRQFVCINRPDNHQADNCPVENHQLYFSTTNTSSTTCDGGLDWWYHASKSYSNPPVNLQYPAQLKNTLLWAGGTENQFLAFDVQGDDVKIDPIPGQIEAPPTAPGSCPQVTFRYNSAGTLVCGSQYSTTNLQNTCCSCAGMNKTFGPMSTTQVDYYKCQ